MIKFTKEEKTVLIFLLASAFLGLAVSHYKTHRKPFTHFQGVQRRKPFTHLGSVSTVKELIDINTAGMGELVKLKRIGPVIAERIISYREEHGRFHDKEGIKNVKGIGEKTYEGIKEKICVR